MRDRLSKNLMESACYLTEESLVQDLARAVTTRNRTLHVQSVAKEFDYSSGRTDLIGLDRSQRIYAFEAKLTKWKKALEQAGRNTSFAHYAYVVLPERSSAGAKRAKGEFQRRGVGLILLGDQALKVEIEPRESKPLLPWLTENARKFVGSK